MLVPADVAEQPYYYCRIAPGVSKSLHPNFPNVHAGKLTETQRPPTKKYSKIPCGDSQTAQLSSQRPWVAEGSYPENETTEKNDYDNGRRRGGGGPAKN